LIGNPGENRNPGSEHAIALYARRIGWKKFELCESEVCVHVLWTEDPVAVLIEKVRV
jgi:hypothetical protein